MTTLTATISQRELVYQCAFVYEGTDYKIFVANRPDGYDAETDVADWELEEITIGGAAPATGTVPAATYNATTGRAEVPVLNLPLVATGDGFSFDTIVVKLSGRDHPHSIIELPAAVVLAGGEARTYVIRLVQDD